jgi:hypothetical protein
MKSFRFKIKLAELIQSIRRSAICSRLLAKVLAALATVVLVFYYSSIVRHPRRNVHGDDYWFVRTINQYFLDNLVNRLDWCSKDPDQPI